MIRFDTYKLYLLGLLMALLYGFSPALSSLFFDTDVPGLGMYTMYFSLCLLAFFLVCYPSVRFVEFRMEVSPTRLTTCYVIAVLSYIGVQIAHYGDFTSAFVVSYTDRTGVEIDGPIKFIFYPITTLFIAITFVYALHLYTEKSARSWWKVLLLASSMFLISALGSRNILLWCLSGVLALVISRLKFRYVFMLPMAFYLFAVLFAFIRNTGLLAVILGTDEVSEGLSWVYFDPNIHEFGSSYRAFELIRSNSSAIEELSNAPYGQVSSFFINQLPSFLKPADFISFTEYISKLYAPPGEGIGSSPMLEALTSNGASLFLLIGLAAMFFWPAYYLRRGRSISFTALSLSIALFFNIWRIGSAEVYKMYISFVVVIFAIQPIIGLRLTRLAGDGKKSHATKLTVRTKAGIADSSSIHE
ncbi:hypothetical protein SRABI118_00501 [Massilia sp. Bi118]|uniref:hypothetical protein n=1 Tax=Massilia sp. Bi118 TaxID=2822346 RepID=UPI001D47A0A3|nr:hypothetical protein [Massilia sp. Bi118]CAH0149837.1 hypothetical protein SRABI118_00501 [Massilia sp. Bi118]